MPYRDIPPPYIELPYPPTGRGREGGGEGQRERDERERERERERETLREGEGERGERRGCAVPVKEGVCRIRNKTQRTRKEKKKAEMLGGL